MAGKVVEHSGSMRKRDAAGVPDAGSAQSKIASAEHAPTWAGKVELKNVTGPTGVTDRGVRALKVVIVGTTRRGVRSY